jgi:hypothetical protein
MYRGFFLWGRSRALSPEGPTFSGTCRGSDACLQVERAHAKSRSDCRNVRRSATRFPRSSGFCRACRELRFGNLVPRLHAWPGVRKATPPSGLFLAARTQRRLKLYRRDWLARTFRFLDFMDYAVPIPPERGRNPIVVDHV